MSIIDIYLGQLTDVFRVGMIVALVFTAANTANQLQRWIPIVLGLFFVAVLIPTTFGTAETPLWKVVAVGILSNATILAVLLLIEQAYRRIVR